MRNSLRRKEAIVIEEDRNFSDSRKYILEKVA